MRTHDGPDCGDCVFYHGRPSLWGLDPFGIEGNCHRFPPDLHSVRRCNSCSGGVPRRKHWVKYGLAEHADACIDTGTGDR